MKIRHCEDEIQHMTESTSVQSFYTDPGNLQNIYYMQDCLYKTPQISLCMESTIIEFHQSNCIIANSNSNPKCQILYFTPKTYLMIHFPKDMLSSKWMKSSRHCKDEIQHMQVSKSVQSF